MADPPPPLPPQGECLEDAASRERALIEATMRAKEEELRALEELRREGGGLFTPRLSLARTPPQAFSTPPPSIMDSSPPPDETPLFPSTGEKRHLSSPEEVQEAMRRRVARRREVPPIGGLITTAQAPLAPVSPQPLPEPAAARPPARAMDEVDPLATAAVEVLAGLATTCTRGIMEAVRSKTSRLNKDEVAAIGAHTERLGAVISHLALRLAAAEARSVGISYSSEQQPQPPTKSFANALRLGKGSAPIPIARAPGPQIAVYPADDQKEVLKTAEDTQKVLRTAIQPSLLGIQIAGVRKVGNAGVVIQTTSEAAAERLRRAVPGTLRTSEPATRQPLIALTGIDKAATLEQVVADLKEQNLPDNEDWTREKLKESLRVLFKRDRHNNRTKWVCQCSNELRRVLVDLRQVYIGWDVVEVTDHLGVTCCSRCQLYGHPEKYCRAKSMVCGNCGEEGHKNTECQATSPTCATCKKFGRRGAQSHRTASRDCPARAHAEQRQVASISY